MLWRDPLDKKGKGITLDYSTDAVDQSRNHASLRLHSYVEP
jgi:hypothetical protein